MNDFCSYIYDTEKDQILEPERTRSVLQPAFCPNNTSVSSLSPTVHNLEQLTLNLPKRVSYMQRKT